MHSVATDGHSRLSGSSSDAISINPTANTLEQSGTAGIRTALNETPQGLYCLFNSSQQQTAISNGPSLFSAPTSSPSDNLGALRTALDGAFQKLSLVVSGSQPPANQPAINSAPVQANADWPYPDLGSSPFMSSPTGSGPTGSFGFNPIYFPTMATAEAIAQMVGGKVVAQDVMLTAPGSPFGQNQPNYMVEMPNGNVFNPGDIAQAISVKQPRAMIDALIYSAVNNTPVAIGQAPPFVPVKSTSSDNGLAAGASYSAQSPAAGAPSFSLSNIDPFISQMYVPPGSSTPADDTAGSVPERIQTILKMMRFLSQMSSIRRAVQPEPQGKRSVSK